MPTDLTTTVWPRRVAAAHFTLAVLTALATVGLLIWTLRQPGANNIDTLHSAIRYVVGAVVLYLAAASVAMLVWFYRWRRGDLPAAPPERWKWRTALTSAIVAGAWGALGGATSRAWLAGLDALLVAAVVVSMLAMLVELVAACTCAGNANDSTGSDAPATWASRGVLLAAIALLASVVYLESRPLPHAPAGAQAIDRSQS